MEFDNNHPQIVNKSTNFQREVGKRKFALR